MPSSHRQISAMAEHLYASTASLTAGAWTQVVFNTSASGSNANWAIYLNGVQAATGTTGGAPVTPSGGATIIGAWCSSSACTGYNGSFKGVLDDASVYNGTLSAFGGTKTSFATGVGSWSPTGSASETKVYKFTYTLSTTTPDTAQGGTAALGFTWEAQNS